MTQTNYQAFARIAADPNQQFLASAWQVMLRHAISDKSARDKLLLDELWPMLYRASITVTTIPALRRAIINCVCRYKQVLKISHIGSANDAVLSDNYANMVKRMDELFNR